jgi:hypothetical protein
MSYLSNADSSSSRHPSNESRKISSHSQAITTIHSRSTDTLTLLQLLVRIQGRVWCLPSQLMSSSWRVVAMAGWPVLHWPEILLSIFSKGICFRTFILKCLVGMVSTTTQTQRESPMLKAFSHRSNRPPHIPLLTRTGRLSQLFHHLKCCSTSISQALRKWSWLTPMGSSKFYLTILCKVRNTKTIRIRKVNKFSRYSTKIRPLRLTCHVSTVKIIKSGAILSVSSQIKWTRNYPSNHALPHSRRHLWFSSLPPTRLRHKIIQILSNRSPNTANKESKRLRGNKTFSDLKILITFNPVHLIRLTE